MNITPLAACSTGLVLVALCALAPPASAKGPEQWYQVPLPEAVANHPAECPCFVTGGPPGGLPAVLVLRASRGRSIGAPVPAVQPQETSIQPSEAFDWADAGVGAGFTAVLGLLVTGGALAFSRRRHLHVTAGSSR
jgi:hypothetical protein